jgi:hypothetical protein
MIKQYLATVRVFSGTPRNKSIKYYCVIYCEIFLSAIIVVSKSDRKLT